MNKTLKFFVALFFFAKLFNGYAAVQDDDMRFVYTNNSGVALDACQDRVTTSVQPAPCGILDGQVTEVYVVSCNKNSVYFQPGLKNIASVRTNIKWAGAFCAPTGNEFTYFIYPDPGCYGEQNFIGPTSVDCVSDAFLNLVASSSKQIGAKGELCNGNPCDAATGNKSQIEVDFSGGNGIPAFSRNYNSLSFATVGLGVGWNHNYSKRLVVNSQLTQIKVIREDGSTQVFNKISSVWIGDLDTQYVLETPDILTGILKKMDGSIENYSLNSGDLLNEIDPYGRTTTFTYSSSNLTQVKGPYGHTIGILWGGSPSRIQKITLPDGRQTVYTQDSGLNLTTITYPNAAKKTYHYENQTFPHVLTGITNQINNRFATFAYGADGKAVLTEHAGSTQKFEFTYTSDTSTSVSLAQAPYYSATFINNLGMKKLVSQTWMDGSFIEQTWDTSNNLLTRTDEIGRTTAFTWDSLNRMSSITDPAGKTTSYTYLANLDLPVTVTSPSVATGQFKVFTTQYDSNNKPIQVTQTGFKPDSTPISKSSSLSWTTSGQVASFTDAGGNVTTFDYWAGTTGGKSGQLKAITNAQNQITQFNTYDNAGRLLTEVSASGITKTYTYDLVGNVKTIVESAGSASKTTTLTYNAASLLLTLTLPNGLVLTYDYDTAQRLTSVKDNLNNKVLYGYDDKNNQTIEEVRDASNNLVRQVQNSFDARNRLNSVNKAGSITQVFYDYASQISSQTDPNNHSTSYQYDLVSRLTQEVNALSGVTLAGYNVNNEVTSVTAPNSANTTYSLDDFGNKLSEVSPDRGALIFTQDANGNVITKTDARGVTANYTYDALNRLTAISYAQPGEDVAFSFDYCKAGKLCGATDASGTWGYTYDALGRMATSAWTTQGQTYTTSYTWTPVDQIATITYPSGRTVDFTRNTIGKISSVTSNGANIATARTYRADGLLTAQNYGNSLNETRAYDLQGRLTTWALAGTDNRAYTYDPNSNVLSITGLPGATYGYDALNRLNSEVGQSFTYDANGNRLSDAAGNYSYTANSNRITSAPQGAVVVNAAGLTTSDQSGNRLFTYGQSGRMLTATVGGNLAGTYSYDFQGHRASKVASGSTVFHYDLDGNLIAETDSSGSTLKEYVWADSAPLAQIASGVTTYLAADHLNTPRMGTNSLGALVWRWDGAAFGESAPVVKSVTVNLRFPGQYFDAETGMHQNWNRDYLPASGRYVQSDPIGINGGINTYEYVGGNPLSGIDPEGLETLFCSRDLGGPNESPREPSGSLLRHDYFVVDGKVFSFQPSDGMIWSQGRIENNESTKNAQCESVSKDPKFDRAMEKAISEVGAPKYNIWAYPSTVTYAIGARNCQSWASDVLRRAGRK